MTYAAAAAAGVFPSRYQRPYQALRGLRAQPIWQPKELPLPLAAALTGLQGEWRVMREEGLRALGSFGIEPENLVDERTGGQWGEAAGTGAAAAAGEGGAWEQLLLYEGGSWLQVSPRD
jgi:hypothetical protein